MPGKDLVEMREKLGRVPPRRPIRRQLFLNFKGGTGKTSVSTSYAFRLAEMGHRVLVIESWSWLGKGAPGPRGGPGAAESTCACA